MTEHRGKPSEPHDRYPVIVIGASAGGVEALREVVGKLPPNLRAYVCVVLHIPPTGVSHLPEILARSGMLPAAHPSIREPMRTGRIYVAPPNRHLIVRSDSVELGLGPRENLSRPSIDVLFRSAAETHGDRTVGVVLSGTRDDGSLGLRQIRSIGGYGIVQDPDDATFRAMPENAIGIAGADEILPASDIAGRVVEIVNSMAGENRASFDPSPNSDLNRDPALVTEATTVRPSVFSCPECGGVLWQHDTGGMMSFRCRIGHAYAPESLFGAQEETAEASLRMAIRVLEEQSDLAGRLEHRAKAQGKHSVADRFARDRMEAAKRAEVLKQLIDGSWQSGSPAASTGTE